MVFSRRNVTYPDLSGQKAKLQLHRGQEEQNEEENGAVLKTGAQKGDRGSGQAAACSGIRTRCAANALGRTAEGTVTGTLE